MISIELNNYSEEDVKLINELKAMGVDEETIQKAYNETQKRRQEESKEEIAMNKIEAVDKFRDELTDKFLSSCDDNDCSKINLLTIDEAYEKCINDIVNEDKKVY